MRVLSALLPLCHLFLYREHCKATQSELYKFPSALFMTMIQFIKLDTWCDIRRTNRNSTENRDRQEAKAIEWYVQAERTVRRNRLGFCQPSSLPSVEDSIRSAIYGIALSLLRPGLKDRNICCARRWTNALTHPLQPVAESYSHPGRGTVFDVRPQIKLARASQGAELWRSRWIKVTTDASVNRIYQPWTARAKKTKVPPWTIPQMISAAGIGAHKLDEYSKHTWMWSKPNIFRQ
jgi:hypothetical protein